jgi:hypothetical protein
MNLKSICILLLLFSSCQKFIQSMDDDYADEISIKSGSDHIKIVFSHNINGETHPCGCRKFPLGGLPQVAGYLHKAQNESTTIYVDTGDMLFQTTKLPPFYEKSMTFTANKLLEAQEMLKLRLFVPGDLDFAQGEAYLAKVSKERKINFLIANLSSESKIKSKPWVSYKLGKRNIYFIGLVNPYIYFDIKDTNFTDPEKALKKSLKEITAEDKPNKTIILLSHGGMDFDRRIAKNFPQVNWIIGAHSQSFLKDPEVENKTKIVQVLSRNHYLGVLKVPLNPKKEIDYELVEVREELEKEYQDNPFTTWLQKYKTELDKIQAEEQKLVGDNDTKHVMKANTYMDCMNCHMPQVEFWQKTSHSIAFHTLISNKASNNPACIKCHSLEFNTSRGFSGKDDIIQGQSLTPAQQEKYWKELTGHFKGVKSIRDLSSEQRAKKAQAWHALDKKYELDYNFANVQCLNCHNQSASHVFDENPPAKIKDYSVKCIECHTQDQSPEWYEENESGLATKLKKDYVQSKIKEIACPKNM